MAPRHVRPHNAPNLQAIDSELVRTPKWLKWEFWPFWLVYTPVYVYGFYLALRARSLAFFTAANPAMRFGGFVDYSKYAILQAVPEAIRPTTLLLEPPYDLASLHQAMAKAQLSYPIVLKPDRGERGFGVARLDTPDAAADYLSRATGALVLQPYIDLPEEYGVLYHRVPGKPGQIHSVVKKEFLVVTGDGKTKLDDLFQAHERTHYHLPMLRGLYQDRLQEVLPAGERLQLISIGNHARGATFLGANHLITEELRATFDRYSQQVPGFYFGRYDLRATSWAEVLAGRFQVIELNGVNSEPAHIYDPHYPLLRAWRDLLHHWLIVYRVSVAVKKAGHPPARFSDLYRAVRRHLAYKRAATQAT